MPATPLKNTLVTMYVNTAVVLNTTNLKENVWFADTDGDIVDNNGGTVTNYLTEITKNGNITWTGAVQDIPNNPSDYVLIQNITISNGNQSKMNINLEPSSPAGGNITHVNGRVNGNPSPLPFKYTINFRVGKIDSNGIRSWNDFQIDPRLIIKGE